MSSTRTSQPARGFGVTHAIFSDERWATPRLVPLVATAGRDELELSKISCYCSLIRHVSRDFDSGAEPSTLADLARTVGLDAADVEQVEIVGRGPVFPTRYDIVTPGATAIAAAALGAAHLWHRRTGRRQHVRVEARRAAAAMRSFRYLRVDGERPRNSPNLTGFYRTGDARWIYLHCNFPNLRDANLGVLDAGSDRELVAAAVAMRDGAELETALHDGGGAGALVRPESEWHALPHVQALNRSPLLEIVRIGDAPPQPIPASERPLAGVRVLDLTRVVAGPIAARTLAEHGADVLRITREDLPDSGDADLDTTIGKRTTHLDLRNPEAMRTIRDLIASGDVFSQSYRPGALDRLGLSPELLAELRPGIVYTTLSAWGHDGPWRERRGYDSIVQAACGMADSGDAPPALLPAAPLDYIAGYLLAFGTMVALGRRATTGGSWLVRTSLGSAAQWVLRHDRHEPADLAGVPDDVSPDELVSWSTVHASPVGRVTHLAPVAQLSETLAHWDLPTVRRGHHRAEWLAATPTSG